jgi:hypothetical protein
MSRTQRNGSSAVVQTKPKKRPESPMLGFPAEWEAMKGRCRNLQPAAAVRECANLSAQYRRIYRVPEIFIDFDKIIATLLKKKIPFVLTGAHGIATWTGRPRSTHDIDILVKSGRNYVRAVNAMKQLYPELEMRTLFGVAAFFVPGETESVIDVTYPHRLDIAQTLETAMWADVEGTRIRIPRLEPALANKYGASLALNRDAGKRGQDMVDFYTMVKHSLDEGREPIDLDRLAELGELVRPGGGGKEILRLVAEAKAGQVPNLTARHQGTQPNSLP